MIALMALGAAVVFVAGAAAAALLVLRIGGGESVTLIGEPAGRAAAATRRMTGLYVRVCVPRDPDDRWGLEDDGV